MVYIAIISLILGILAGQLVPEVWSAFFRAEYTEYILYVLMLSVGISIGLNKQVFQKLKKYHIKICLLPVTTIMASLLGGAAGSFILRLPLKEGLSVASGMGWYSLSGVMISNLYSPTLGTIAFMSNLLREIFSFIMIPFIVRYLNPYAAIAPAGATSEDTTLPMLIKYADEETVVMAIFHGVICSACVPILIKFFLK